MLICHCYCYACCCCLDFFICFHHTWVCPGFIPGSVSRDHSWRPWGPFVVPETEPGSVSCNPGALPLILFLDPSCYFIYLFVCITLLLSLSWSCLWKGKSSNSLVLRRGDGLFQSVISSWPPVQYEWEACTTFLGADISLGDVFSCSPARHQGTFKVLSTPFFVSCGLVRGKFLEGRMCLGDHTSPRSSWHTWLWTWGVSLSSWLNWQQIPEQSWNQRQWGCVILRKKQL